MKQTHAVKMLAAMAHDGRLKLVRRLIKAGPEGVTAGKLAKFAKIGPTTASAQLLVLTNAGLVRGQRRGRHIVYTADYDKMQGLLGFLMLDCCGGRADICAPIARACC